MTVWERVGRFTAAIFYLAPWVWLLCFAAFTAAGAGLVAYVIFGNPAGLSNWLFD